MQQQTVLLGVLNDEFMFDLLGLAPAHLPWPHSL